MNVCNIFKIILILFIISILLCGILQLGVSYSSFETLKQRIDVFSLDGSADVFTQSFFSKIVKKLRISSVLFIVLSAVLYSIKGRVLLFLTRFFESLRVFINDILNTFKKTIGEEERIHIYALLVIIFIAVFLRSYYLLQPIRYDEAHMFNAYASQPLYIGLTNYSAANNHLFHTFLIHITCLVFGDKLWAIRLYDFIAGILMVPVSYMAMRMFYDKYTGLIAAGIIASSSALIEFSTNARSYTIISLICLMLFAVLKYLKNKRNTAAWGGVVILSCIGLYTTTAMIPCLGIAVVWFFLSVVFNDMGYSRRQILKDFTLSLLFVICLTTILYSPVIITSGLNSILGNDVIDKFFRGSSFDQLSFFSVAVWNLFNRDVPYVIYLVLIFGFIVSLLFHKKLSNDRVSIFIAVVLVIALMVSVDIVPRWMRHWLFLLPIYIGIASAGVAFLIRLIGLKVITKYRHILFASFSVLTSLWLCLCIVSSQSVYYSEDTGTLRDAEDITFYIKQKLKPDDRILANCPSDSPLLYYFNLHNVSSKFLFDSPATGGRIFIVVNLPAKQTLGRIIGNEKVVKDNYSTPRLIKKYEFANLYVMNRIY